LTAAPPRRTTITIGTRASRLARWQAQRVAALLESANPDVVCRTVEFTTAGDRTLDRPIPEVGGKGVFTAELEQALREHRIDVAVHSLKDLPVGDSPDLVLGAVCDREDPRDVLVSANATTLAELPQGATVGTSSTRRTAQLLAARPDLRMAPIRGNVDTRVEKAKAGEYDAIVLAAAGLKRLGLESAIRQHLPLGVMLPAPGQGALAVQCREDDATILSLVEKVDDPACRGATHTERAFLEALGGGCSAPIGGHATCAGGGPDAHLSFQGVIAAADGSRMIRCMADGTLKEAAMLGRQAAKIALGDGAEELLT
jgi:hydroxymethylbilane synthase